MRAIKAIGRKTATRFFTGLDLAWANLVHELRRPTRLGSTAGRLGEPRWSRELIPSANSNAVLLCIFVAYSPNATLSTISYLMTLRNAGFEILFVNNKPTAESFLDQLASICWRVYDRVNIGRDIGAYKDGILLLHEEGLLGRCEALCIANDSIQFVPGRHGDSLTHEIRSFLESPAAALFSHDSHQIAPHYQSFFQILKGEVIVSSAFLNFWTRYRPLSQRGHCIRNGEVKASQQVYNKISNVQVIYTTQALLRALVCLSAETQISVEQVLAWMPSVTHTMQRKDRTYALDQLVLAAKGGGGLGGLHQHCLAELIEASNPSHVAAFLYAKFLLCPLIKKDLCLAGSFSIGRALQLFREVLMESGLGVDEVEARVEEFRLIIAAKGVPADFRRSPRKRALRGVPEGFTYAGP